MSEKWIVIDSRPIGGNPPDVTYASYPRKPPADPYQRHREAEESGALDASARAKFDREREARMARNEDIIATFGRPYNGLRLEERKRKEAEAAPWSVDSTSSWED